MTEENKEVVGAGSEVKAAEVEKKGVQNILDVIAFAVALEGAIKKAKADGKVDLSDIGLLFPVAPLFVPMIDNIGEIPKEFSDLDEEEIVLIVDETAKLLSESNKAKVIVKIKAALKFAHSAYELYNSFKK